MIPGYDLTKNPNLLYSHDPDNLFTVRRGIKEHAEFNDHFTANEDRRLSQMIREYNKALVSKGYAKSRSQIKNLDRIDIRGMLDFNLEDLTGSDIPTDSIEKLREELKKQNIEEFRSKLGIYSSIPCYSEGVLQITSNRYIYWKVESIDLTDESEVEATIFLKDYMANNDVWQPSYEGTAKFIDTYFYIDSEYKNMSEVLSNTEVIESLSWDQTDLGIWKKFKKFNRSLEEYIQKFETTQFKELVKVFIKLITMVNFKLSLEKPVADRKANKKIHATYIEDQQPKRLIRTIGGISFSSVKLPRSSCKETVIKYKVASWKARGGFRHLADGRIIPFKESIRHRKALLPAAEVPTSILKVK